MFFIEDLKSLSVGKLQRRLELPVQSIPFTECVREIYLSTHAADELRSTIVDATIVQRRKSEMMEGIADLVREGGDFAVDYFVVLEKQLIL
jgi:hypothetical protein